MRLETFSGQRGGHAATQILEIAAQQAVCASLNQDITDCGRLHGAGDHRRADAVGDQLTEQAVSGAATDQVNRLDRNTRQRGGLVDAAGESGGEAFDDGRGGSTR